MPNLKKDSFFIFIALFFFSIYALVSVVNHYLFRTYALDLGAYTNALFDYRNFRFNDSLVFKDVAENLLADHFDLYLIIFSPLSFIFGTYTLIILQISFIIFGAYGVYRYFNNSPEKKRIALYASLFFFSFFGVFSAVSFDYHSNVIATTLVPWFFYFVKDRKFIYSGLLLFFILISKENISLWMFFVCLGLFIDNRKNKSQRIFLSLSMMISLGYFILITSLVMPKLSNEGQYPHFLYSQIGNTPIDVLKYLLIHPIEAFKILFSNHTHHPNGDFVKLELHLLVFFSGLPLLFFKPQYLLMLIPIYLQKLLHDNYIMWSVFGQYSIEFLPIIAIGGFSVISKIKNVKGQNAVIIILLVGSIGSTIRLMDNTVMHNSKSRLRIYQKSHYTRDFNVKELHRVFDSIPCDAVISAQSPFVPHLSLRDNIYQFPVIKDATFVIFSKNEETYPMEKEDFNVLTEKLKNDSLWETHYKNNEITIMKKRK